MLPKLVVFDVDGTLITYDGVCAERTQNALAALRSAGVTVAVATGRPLGIIDETLAGIGQVDFAVCGNGSTTQDRATGELLRDAVLPADVVVPLIEQTRRSAPGVGTAIELRTGMLEESGFARRVPPSSHPDPVADVLASLGDGAESARKVIFFHDEFDNDLAALAGLVERAADDRCGVSYGILLPIVEVAPVGDHKAVALQGLVDHLGFSAAETTAFGDGTNDVEMLQWAGTGIAMGNAADVTKAAADLVTATVGDGGVAVFLETLLAGDPS